MKLNRYNYEEYFILYLDNELSDEDRREVELFVQQNPDLKSELDILLQSKLTPDTDISFADKTSLMMFGSAPINMTNYEEWLLSYIDDELTNEQRKEVEQFIADKPALQKELSLFQKTKLQREEAIVFPGKESLYHREEKAKVIVIGWRRIAIAAALLIGILTTGIVLLNNKSTGDKNNGGIAKGKTEKEIKVETPDINSDKKHEVAPSQEPEAIAPKNDEQIAVTTPMKNESSLKDKESKKGINKANDQKNLAIEKDQFKEIQKEEKENGALAVNKGNGLPEPTQENKYVNNSAKPEEAITGNVPTEIVLTDTPKKTDAAPVTTETQKPSDIQNEATGTTKDNPDAHFASNNEGKSNKGGVRGFLRKVTRTFEKRTNIKATDDDDRLLIAGLAIKLN